MQVTCVFYAGAGQLHIEIASARLSPCVQGNPDAPRCGFSQKVVSALRSIQVPFNSFDILTDDAIRQGLKEYSQWPTYPQLYVKGELLGGCDVILEMQQEGEMLLLLLCQLTSQCLAFHQQCYFMLEMILHLCKAISKCVSA